MTIQEEIDADLKDAMRSKDAERLSVLRMVKSALTNAAIEKRLVTGGLADSEAVGVIRKQVKQRRDSIESFEKGGRPELAARMMRTLIDQTAPGGLVWATNVQRLTTGFSTGLTTEADFFYYRRPHIGATGWAALATLGASPFDT